MWCAGPSSGGAPEDVRCAGRVQRGLCGLCWSLVPGPLALLESGRTSRERLLRRPRRLGWVWMFLSATGSVSSESLRSVRPTMRCETDLFLLRGLPRFPGWFLSLFVPSLSHLKGESAAKGLALPCGAEPVGAWSRASTPRGCAAVLLFPSLSLQTHHQSGTSGPNAGFYFDKQ